MARDPEEKQADGASDVVPGLRALVSELERAVEAGRPTRSLELLRAIRTLGFDIVPREPAAVEGSSELADAVAGAEQLLGTGEALLAMEALSVALGRWPDELRLRQLRGLAFARCGATWRANELLRELRDAGHRDGETLGLLARTHKDLAIAAREPAERRRQFELALVAYKDGYEAALRDANTDDALFTGVNAATVGLLLGQPGEAANLARDVRSLAREQLASEGDAASYWLHATLGETALLLGDNKEAAIHYRLSAERAAGHYSNLSSTRGQARRVLASRSEDASWLDEILVIPPVVLFSGHMIDRPGRAKERFPAAAEAAVATELRERLTRLDPSAVYASAACGGDLLFLEAAHERGCEYHVVLPFSPDAFATASVSFASSHGRAATWRERFDDILAGAASVTTASDDLASGSTSTFVYSNLVLEGMAALHAAALDCDLVGVAVWDGKPGDGPGGTASVVENWRSRGIAVDYIRPTDPATSWSPDLPAPTSPLHADPGSATDLDPDIELRDTPHRLVAMLFADAVGYSKLSEDQTPLFIDHVFAPIARLIEESNEAPILKETTGDGFYFVFRSVRDAGLFSLALQDLIAGIDFQARGLPATMALRTALHCGPVHCLLDPITGRQIYTGPHTSRTARIEPVAPPGLIYASEAFATLAAASGIAEFSFEYVGLTALAKSYGSLRLYHMSRANT